MAIVLDQIGVDFILLEPTVPEIFYFKHDVGYSIIMVFKGSPDVGNIGDAILVLSSGIAIIRQL